MGESGGLDFCFDRFPFKGPAYLFDAGESAGWYSALCGLIATAVLVGIQARLGRTNGRDDRTGILCLSATLVVALLGAFVNAELAGEVECNVLAARVTLSGAMIAAAALLLLLSLGWILAEHGISSQALWLLHACLVFVVALALAYLAASVQFSEEVTHGGSVSLTELRVVAAWAPAAVLLAAVIAFRWRHRNRWRISADDAINERWVRWLCGGVVTTAISALLLADLRFVSIDANTATLPSLAPTWTKYLVMWSVGCLGALCVLAFPWKTAIPASPLDPPPSEPEAPASPQLRDEWVTITIRRRRRH